MDDQGRRDLIPTDRSRIESYYDCPRKRYWQYEYRGWGVVPDAPVAEDLAYGIGFHSGAEVLGSGGSLEDALAALVQEVDKIVGITLDGEEKKDEYRALGYCHLRALDNHILPKLRAEYVLRLVETEIALELGGGVVDLNRLDIALQERSSGDNYLVEWKTDADPSNIYQRMAYNLQFVLGVPTLEKALGEPVKGSIIIAVDKGQRRGPNERERREGKSGERRDSIWTYCYHRDGELRREWTRGFAKTPTWRLPGGVEGWYNWLTTADGYDPMDSFVITPPILWDRAHFEDVKRQVINIERNVRFFSQTMPNLDELPMNLKNCKNDGGYRRQCPFVALCHEGKGGDPLSWGYKWREENHPLEATLRRRPE